MDHLNLGSLLELYVSDRHRRGDFGTSTLPAVRWHLRSFCRFAGPIGPGQISPALIDEWLCSAPLARSTVRHRLSWFRGWCRWMVLHGHMPADPTRDLPRIRQPKPSPRTLRVADIHKLLLSISEERLRLVVLLMIHLGLRAVEVSRAELGDVDFDNRTLLVHGKGGEQRLLPIPDEAWSALVRYVGRSRSTGPLIRNVYRPSEGLSAQYIVVLVSRAMAAAGVAGTGHALRHSMAAHVLRSGRGDVRDIQQVLGHASLATTAIYLPHSDVDRLREVLEGRRYAA